MLKFKAVRNGSLQPLNNGDIEESARGSFYGTNSAVRSLRADSTLRRTAASSSHQPRNGLDQLLRTN